MARGTNSVITGFTSSIAELISDITYFHQYTKVDACIRCQLHRDGISGRVDQWRDLRAGADCYYTGADVALSLQLGAMKRFADTTS
jgi:hypothetical protein